MAEEALLVEDIEGERVRANRLYEDGIIGIRRRDSWLRKLEYQAQVRGVITASLEDADYVIVDAPLGRDHDEQQVAPQAHQQAVRRVGKFARSL